MLLNLSSLFNEAIVKRYAELRYIVRYFVANHFSVTCKCCKTIAHIYMKRNMERPSINYSILFSIGILLSATSCVPTATGYPGGPIGVVGVGERMRSTSVDQGDQVSEEAHLGFDGFSTTGGASGENRPENRQTQPSRVGTTIADPATAFDTMSIQPSMDKLISQSSWFALASGVASIIGLIVTMYGTQISTIPFSLYRSHVWNRVLLLSFGIGIIVFAGMQFYTQTERPAFPPLYYISSFLHGDTLEYRLPFGAYISSNGTNLWGIILFIGSAILTLGIIYDPMQISKSVMFREHNALLEYRKEQLSSVLGENDYENLKSHERHLYDDLSDFHVELQTRLIDTVYGQGPRAMFTRRTRSNNSGKKGDTTKATEQTSID